MKREIKALTMCKHPNPVRIFVADEREDPNCYIMEFLQRGNLFSQADYKRKTLDVLSSVRGFAEAADLGAGA